MDGKTDVCNTASQITRPISSPIVRCWNPNGIRRCCNVGINSEDDNIYNNNCRQENAIIYHMTLTIFLMNNVNTFLITIVYLCLKILFSLNAIAQIERKKLVT